MANRYFRFNQYIRTCLVNVHERAAAMVGRELVEVRYRSYFCLRGVRTVQSNIKKDLPVLSLPPSSIDLPGLLLTCLLFYLGSDRTFANTGIGAPTY